MSLRYKLLECGNGSYEVIVLGKKIARVIPGNIISCLSAQRKVMEQFRAYSLDEGEVRNLMSEIYETMDDVQLLKFYKTLQKSRWRKSKVSRTLLESIFME
ncbi:hypothetical protein HYW75_07050 [Candidatus Pacearchaeota archaeon]|nr:hypothetical protein [Candidatus Pacearchaeota archaeon]